jgi:hypothetical protein
MRKFSDVKNCQNRDFRLIVTELLTGKSSEKVEILRNDKKSVQNVRLDELNNFVIWAKLGLFVKN